MPHLHLLDMIFGLSLLDKVEYCVYLNWLRSLDSESNATSVQIPRLIINKGLII